MTANEIRKKLQPFKDFAPAILAAADICDAADKAEAFLAEFNKGKTAREAELSELDSRINLKQREIQKYNREVAMLKPDSNRMRDLNAREQSVRAREAAVLAREEKILAREEKAKDLQSKLAGFASLDS